MSDSPPHYYTPELRLILRLAAAPLGGVGPVDAEVDIDRLIRLLRQHRLTMAALEGWRQLDADGLLPPPPSRIAELAMTDRRQAIAAAGWLARLGRALDETGIAWCAIKGPALSQQIHGDPAARSARDLDILVDRRVLPAAVAIASGLGWQVADDWQAIADLTGKFDLELGASIPLQPPLEIHRSLTPDHSGTRFAALDELSVERVVLLRQGVPTLRLDQATVYVAWHGAKHLWMRLHWLLDLAALLNNHDRDLHAVVELARRCGAERSLRAGHILCRQLLQVPLDDLPRASIGIERAAARLAGWGAARAALGPALGATGRRPWSYRWHLREGQVSDHGLGLALHLRGLAAPVGPDVRLIGPGRPHLYHLIARPYLLGRRIASDTLRLHRRFDR